MSRQRHHWTREAELELIRRYAGSEGMKTIAWQMGLGEKVVKWKVDQLCRIGVLARRNRPWSPAEDAILLACRDAGIDQGELATVLRRSRAAVHMQLCKLRKAKGAASEPHLRLAA